MVRFLLAAGVVLWGWPLLLPAQTTVAEKPGFRDLVPESAMVEKVAGGFQFTEGPAWSVKSQKLIFSDIPANCMCIYDPTTQKASLESPSSKEPNGNFITANDSLYTCHHGSRCVREVDLNEGHGSTLADRYEGKAFNSPNDVVVKRDGTVWFTDPTYGLGNRRKEQTANRVYCVDSKTRVVCAVAEDFDEPNGLCFSPDEKRLYVADSGQGRNVRVYDVNPDNTLSNGRVFCAIDKGVPDGMRCDEHGNLFSTSAVGIQVFNPAGERLGIIPVPETPANLCFGGTDGHDLYITARTSLYRIRVNTGPASTGK